MQPRRTVPVTSSRSAATSASRASSSAWTRRARRTTAWPSSVRKPPVRSTRVTPSSRSSRARWVETFDCTVCSARAAAEKLPPSATAIEGGELAEIHRWSRWYPSETTV